MCKCVLPPGDNPIAVDKYIIIIIIIITETQTLESILDTAFLNKAHTFCKPEFLKFYGESCITRS
jgi:hypothetical protein